MRCDILLPTGQTIPVTEDDVKRVLGFPKGPKKIVLLKKKQTTTLYEEWKQQFPGRNPALLKITEVKDAMIAHEDGGKWFKIHFMIMVVQCLIKSTRSGCVQPRFIKCLEDLKTVDQWNWCEFVIRSLIENKPKWAKDTSQMYIGPTMFLTLFFVDRVRWANSDIRRDFPLFTNWDTKKLKIRESSDIKAGGFGDGVLVGPIDLIVATAHVTERVRRQVVPTIAEDGHHGVQHSMPSFAEKLVKNLGLFKQKRDEIVGLINSADEATQRMEGFKEAYEEAKRLLCIPAQLKIYNFGSVEPINGRSNMVQITPGKGSGPDQAHTTHGQVCRETSAQQTPVQNLNDLEDFWYNEEFYRSSADLVSKKLGKKTFNVEMPSFSLGFTQPNEVGQNESETTTHMGAMLGFKDYTVYTPNNMQEAETSEKQVRTEKMVEDVPGSQLHGVHSLVQKISSSMVTDGTVGFSPSLDGSIQNARVPIAGDDMMGPMLDVDDLFQVDVGNPGSGAVTWDPLSQVKTNAMRVRTATGKENLCYGNPTSVVKKLRRCRN